MNNLSIREGYEWLEPSLREYFLKYRWSYVGEFKAIYYDLSYEDTNKEVLN